MNTMNRILIAGGLFGAATVLSAVPLHAQRSGVEAWSQTCGNCHVIQPPVRYSGDQWTKIMMHMRITARLPDAEADAILEFLRSGARPVASSQGSRADDEGLPFLASSDPTLLAPLYEAPDPAEDYQNYCVACHGNAGAGDGPAAAAFDPRPTDFTDPEYQEARTDEELVQAITTGAGGMPGFSTQLTQDKIEALVRYIRTLADAEK